MNDAEREQVMRSMKRETAYPDHEARHAVIPWMFGVRGQVPDETIGRSAGPLH